MVSRAGAGIIQGIPKAKYNGLTVAFKISHESYDKFVELLSWQTWMHVSLHEQI